MRATLCGRKVILTCLAALLALAVAGCPDRREVVSGPRGEVRLVRLHPFTTVKLPEQAGGLGGIDVRVEALGVFRFELYGYRPHQADPRGKRLATWTVDLSDPEANERFWDPILLSYKIPLGAQPIPAKSERLLLELIFTPPEAGRLFDRHVLSIPAGEGPEGG